MCESICDSFCLHASQSLDEACIRHSPSTRLHSVKVDSHQWGRTLRASSVASAPLLYEAQIFSSSLETVVHSSA